ncbi:hypothetical protein [Haladaptatus sp. NG-SE-30]
MGRRRVRLSLYSLPVHLARRRSPGTREVFLLWLYDGMPGLPTPNWREQ